MLINLLNQKNNGFTIKSHFQNVSQDMIKMLSGWKFWLIFKNLALKICKMIVTIDIEKTGFIRNGVHICITCCSIILETIIFHWEPLNFAFSGVFYLSKVVLFYIIKGIDFHGQASKFGPNLKKYRLNMVCFLQQVSIP